MQRTRSRKKLVVNNFLFTRGFGRSIGFGKRPALLTIDMMNAFTNPELPFGTPQEHTVKAINQILHIVHNKHVPCFFTVVRYEQRDLTDAGLWFRKMRGLATLRAGTQNTEIDTRITRQPDDAILVKKYASAFFGTDLLSRLNSRRIDTIFLTGCTTSGCVRATAVDAIQFGLRPIVVAEAVADRSQSAHKQSLLDLQAKYADVVSLSATMKYFRSLKKFEIL
mgnify:FL=1